MIVTREDRVAMRGIGAAVLLAAIANAQPFSEFDYLVSTGTPLSSEEAVHTTCVESLYRCLFNPIFYLRSHHNVSQTLTPTRVWCLLQVVGGVENWAQAEADCSDVNGFDGHLASISSDAELAHIVGGQYFVVLYQLRTL